MSVLPDHEIRDLAWDRLIVPFSMEQLQPASYDVRLGHKIMVPHFRDPRAVDLGDRETIMNRTEEIDITDGYLLQNGRFVLASTVEHVEIPRNIVGAIEGKSSVARTGLQIHCAGYLDPGFKGYVTMELVNFFDLPVILRPGVLIAQLSFRYLSSPCDVPYQGRYQNAPGVEGSKYDPNGKMPDKA